MTSVREVTSAVTPGSHGRRGGRAGGIRTGGSTQPLIRARARERLEAKQCENTPLARDSRRNSARTHRFANRCAPQRARAPSPGAESARGSRAGPGQRMDVFIADCRREPLARLRAPRARSGSKSLTLLKGKCSLSIGDSSGSKSLTLLKGPTQHPTTPPRSHPPAPPRTTRTRRVPHPVLIGHAASVTPYAHPRPQPFLVLRPLSPPPPRRATTRRRRLPRPRTRRTPARAQPTCTDETCPFSTEGWLRRVHLVRGGGGGAPARWHGAPRARAAPADEPPAGAAKVPVKGTRRVQLVRRDGRDVST